MSDDFDTAWCSSCDVETAHFRLAALRLECSDCGKVRGPVTPGEWLTGEPDAGHSTVGQVLGGALVLAVVVALLALCGAVETGWTS